MNEDEWRRALFGSTYQLTPPPMQLGAALGFQPFQPFTPAPAPPPPTPEPAPPAPIADTGEKKPEDADKGLSVGTSPTAPTGAVKQQNSGSAAGKAIGGAAGAGIGFAVGGPIGAGIGSTLGSWLGSLF